MFYDVAIEKAISGDTGSQKLVKNRIFEMTTHLGVITNRDGQRAIREKMYQRVMHGLKLPSTPAAWDTEEDDQSWRAWDAALSAERRYAAQAA